MRALAYDAIVIGAGFAGLTAGLRLAEAGQRVLLLAQGHGTTHWLPGTIGVADAPNPLAAVARLGTAPDHPYARAGGAALSAAVTRLGTVCAAADYPLTGVLDRNMRLPTALGALRLAAIVPTTMVAGAQAGEPGGEVLIAGFRELRDFFPGLAAANLRAQGVAARAVYLDLPPTTRRRDFPTTIVAQLFEDAQFRADVGRQLRAARGAATTIGLPAVLGLRRAAAIVAELTAWSDAPVFEIPTPPPSVPGIRLYEIAIAAFRQAGGRLQLGSSVERVEAGPEHTLAAVYTEAAARQQRHTAARFVLATGGLAGGGLRALRSGEVIETALGLPVRAPTGRAHWFASQLLAPAGHAIYRAGIATDRSLRPLDADGTIVYNNVTVAGAALAGADLIREGSYEGVALATGWAAADS